MVGRSVIITGGAGFLGSHLVLQVLRQGDEVAILDHYPAKSPFYEDERVTVFNADIRDYSMLKAIKDYDYVVHLAANVDVRSSVSDPMSDASNNITGSINILEACREFSKPVIYASSAAVYGNGSSLPLKEDAECKPSSPYGLSKYTAERYFQMFHELYHVKSVSLRFLNIAGPLKRKGAFYSFADALVNKKPITIYGDGEQSRDFCCVGDAVGAIMQAMQTKRWGEIYNIGTGKSTTVNELLKMFRRHHYGDNNVLYKEKIAGEIRASYADIRKARDILDWSPKEDLANEIERTISWAKLGMDNAAWRELNGI